MRSGTGPGSAFSRRNSGRAGDSSSAFRRRYETRRVMSQSPNDLQRGSRTSRRVAIHGKPMSTVLCFFVAFAMARPALAQVPNPLLPHNLSPWGMFLNADIVVKAVMIGLAFASLVTWTVWLAKTIELALARRRARRRIGMLETGAGLVDAARTCNDAKDAIAQLIQSTA